MLLAVGFNNKHELLEGDLILCNFPIVCSCHVESSLCRVIDRMEIGNCILYCSIIRGVSPVIF